MKIRPVLAALLLTAACFAPDRALADCDFYWTGSEWVNRCQEPPPADTGSNCHWETNGRTGQAYWVCD